MLRERLRIFLSLVCDVLQGRAKLIAENALLRQQVLVLQRGVPRPRRKPRDRWTIATITGAFPVSLDVVAIVHPETAFCANTFAITRAGLIVA
jgi:hypothetical protein